MTDLDQHHFDHLLPCKPLLRVQEVADLLQVSDSTVEKLIDVGQLVSYGYCAGTGQRVSKRIPRQSILLFLLKSTNYEIEDYLAGILRLLSTLSVAELTAIRVKLPRLVEQAAARKPDKQQPVQRR